MNKNLSPVTDLRVALTADEFDRLTAFYRAGLGLEPAQVWPEDQGRSLVLDLGTATLEIFDEKQAETVDLAETGERNSGKVRFALEVPDLDKAAERLLKFGAKMISPAKKSPWGDRTARFSDPEGMQITLFENSK